jgi:hypothetical protein
MFILGKRPFSKEKIQTGYIWVDLLLLLFSFEPLLVQNLLSFSGFSHGRGKQEERKNMMNHCCLERWGRKYFLGIIELLV